MRIGRLAILDIQKEGRAETFDVPDVEGDLSVFTREAPLEGDM